MCTTRRSRGFGDLSRSPSGLRSEAPASGTSNTWQILVRVLSATRSLLLLAPEEWCSGRVSHTGGHSHTARCNTRSQTVPADHRHLCRQGRRRQAGLLRMAQAGAVLSVYGTSTCPGLRSLARSPRHSANKNRLVGSASSRRSSRQPRGVFRQDVEPHARDPVPIMAWFQCQFMDLRYRSYGA